MFLRTCCRVHANCVDAKFFVLTPMVEKLKRKLRPSCFFQSQLRRSRRGCEVDPLNFGGRIKIELRHQWPRCPRLADF